MAKTFVGKILAGIVSIFGSIFKHVIEGAEKTFNELPPETQQALIHGSGIMDIIKSMLDKTPDEVRAAIQETYPDVNITALETGLFTIAHAFNLAPAENNLDDCITKLQEYLTKVTDNTVWDSILHTASLILAVVLSPKGNVFGAVASLIEYVYQKFIQKK